MPACYVKKINFGLFAIKLIQANQVLMNLVTLLYINISIISAPTVILKDGHCCAGSPAAGAESLKKVQNLLLFYFVFQESEKLIILASCIDIRQRWRTLVALF